MVEATEVEHEELGVARIERFQNEVFKHTLRVAVQRLCRLKI